MAILRKKEIRNMNEKDMDKKLSELNLEVAKERANISIGATVTSPGRIKEIRKTIARIKTLKREKKGKVSK
jgi:large subunit ribosomal protein L29